MDDPFIEYIESRRDLVSRTIEQLERLCLDFKEELADLDAAMKVRLRMKARPAPAASDVASTVKSITEMPKEKPAPVAAPEKASAIEPPAEKPPAPGRGPQPRNPERPAGIPTNLEMCITAIRQAGRPLSGAEIRHRVAERWWPDVPRDWKSTPFGFLASGKLVKNGDNLFDLPPVPVPPPAAKAESAPPKAPPAVKPSSPAPNTDLGSGPRMFEHHGVEIGLPLREWRVVSKLHAAMGLGLIDFIALTDLAFKGEGRRSAINPRIWLEQTADIINRKLVPVGLKMVQVPMVPKGPMAGYVLKELP